MSIRNASSRALRRLSSSPHQIRHLHITGPTTVPSRVLTSSHSLGKPAKEATGTAAEVPKRSLSQAASADVLPATSNGVRAMTTAHAPARLQPSSTFIPQRSTREFNTSRSRKAPKDTSTMDFAYLPTEPAPVPMDNVNLRVPLIPDNYAPRRTGVHAPLETDYGNTMPAQVVTAAGENTYVSAPSAMSDVHDNSATSIDYGALAERMGQTAQDLSNQARQSQGTVKQLWSGMVDDIFGPKRATA